MTDDKFNKGFKLLMRYLKEQKRYNDFKRITVGYFKLTQETSYKNYLKTQFKTNGYTWWQFFDYSIFVGNDWLQYHDNGLNHLREGWHRFIENEDIF